MRNVFEKSKWIWLAEGAIPDSYAEFSDSFVYEGGVINVNISVDSDYTLWVNGKYAASGQYGDFEHYKIYDTVDITEYLAAGENSIKILVHHFGISTIRYRAAAAGLIYEIVSGDKVIAASCESVLSRKSPTYESGRQVFVSKQLGFTFFYDATKECNGGYTPSHAVEKNCEFFPRPIKKSAVYDRRCGTVISDDKTVGTHFLIDLGGEVVGLPSLEFIANSKTHLTVAWGEHIVDGCVRKIIADRSFYYEYTSAIGHNSFTNYMLRLGCRYLEVFADEPIELVYCGVLPQVYEIDEVPVSIEGELDRKIYDACVRTLRCCMMEHYVDCPWREQALYPFDSRNQMLFGYYAFEGGNAEYAKSNLKLLGNDRRPDRFISMCAPSGWPLVIPTFSLYYIIEMNEYMKYTSDSSLAEEFFEKMRGVLEEFKDNMENGLVLRFIGEYLWNFYDWGDFISGGFFKTDTNKYPDLIINCLFIMALDAFSEICEKTNRKFEYAELRQSLREKTREAFMTEDGVFTFRKGYEELTTLGNSFAILAGLVNDKEANAICDKIVSGALTQTSLSMCVWKYDALLATDADKYKDYILSEIRRDYKSMLDTGIDTIWEKLDSTHYSGGAGSLCHGWSSIPIYIFHRLGIAKPL